MRQWSWHYLLGGFGLVLIVDGILGLGFPWTVIAGFVVYQLAYKLMRDRAELAELEDLRREVKELRERLGEAM